MGDQRVNNHLAVRRPIGSGPVNPHPYSLILPGYPDAVHQGARLPGYPLGQHQLQGDGRVKGGTGKLPGRNRIARQHGQNKVGAMGLDDTVNGRGNLFDGPDGGQVAVREHPAVDQPVNRLPVKGPAGIVEFVGGQLHGGAVTGFRAAAGRGIRRRQGRGQGTSADAIGCFPMLAVALHGFDNTLPAVAVNIDLHVMLGGH